MTYILVILLCKLIQPILNKKCSMELSGTKIFMKYIVIRQGVAAGACLLLAGGVLRHTNLSVLLLAMAFALCLTLCTYAGIAAMQSSAMVLVSLFEMAGLLVPCIAGIFIFDEPLNVMHGIGLLACLLSSWLLTGGQQEKHTHLSVKGWLLLFACLLSNGGIMLTQKMLSHLCLDSCNGAFHFWAFLFSTIFAALILLFADGKDGSQATVSTKLSIYGIILSVALLMISMLSTRAAATVPAVVLFSAVNGGGLLMCTLVSAIMYRERITRKTVIGLVVGALALMLINFA